MRTVKLAVLSVAMALVGLFALPAAASAATNEADLSVSVQFVGHGKPKARQGDLVTLAFSVTNNGPSTAQSISVDANASDQFNVISTICDDLAPVNNVSGPCPDLAPGETVTGTVVLQICCFNGVKERRAFASVSVSSANDPDESNDTAFIDILMIGAPQ